MSKLAERVRLVFEQALQNNSDRTATRKEVAGTVLISWIKERLAHKQCDKYCNLMKSQGKPPLEKPDYFRKYKGANSIYDRYKYIESSGIKIGSQVRHRYKYITKIFEIIGISVDCKLIFKRLGKKHLSSQEPTIYEMV